MQCTTPTTPGFALVTACPLKSGILLRKSENELMLLDSEQKQSKSA